ncbi:hypothetical protein PGT21_019304 [Puccinia graminis f. sp. tritici]|nr:hypothetical protein PGT21_019304 [Puccinia graminis f. sp. tritici]KAA1075561.1 hypothetical protein PGTUg99_025035 [Puccinia graminis f. sp. tritici]
MAYIKTVHTSQSNGFALPIYEHLAVERIWTWGPPPDPFGTMQTRFLDLDALIDLFSDTIVELTIEVTNFFTLPSATIERIGRLKRLRALRIRIRFSSKKKYMRGLEFKSDQIPGGLPTDSECLCKLLKAAQRLATLDLGYFRPVCSAKTFSLGNHEFSSITNLELSFKEIGNITQDGIVSMSSALPNLKLLAIWGNGFNHSQDLLPIFEIFSNRLEVIQFSNHLFLYNIFDLNFPKLRVLRFYSRPDESCADLMVRRPLFAHTPLEGISVDAPCFGCTGVNRANSPAALPHFQRTVYYWTSSSLPAERSLKRCGNEDYHRVRYIRVRSRDRNITGRMSALDL